MLKEYVKYYYEALDKVKKEAYLCMYDALKDKKDRAVLPSCLAEEDLKTVLWAVYNDCPSFYYIDPYNYRFSSKGGRFTIFFNYIYSKEKIAEFDKRLADGLAKFKAANIRDDMSDYEKELVIHNFLVRFITYDKFAVSSPKTISEAYNVIGALLCQTAVCWGISLAFKLIADYCRLKAFVVVGAGNAEWAKDNHAWNIVKLDGREYHLDVTWDIREKGSLSYYYDYFNLSDALISFNHSWNTSIYPRCSENKYNYYYRNGLYVKKTEDIAGFTERRFRDGKEFMALKFAADNMPDYDTILEEVKKGLRRVFRDVLFNLSVSPVTHNIYLEIQAYR